MLLAVLTFVPSRYFYPTKPGKWNRAICVLAALWGVSLVMILILPPETRKPWLEVSMVFPVGYLVLSWGLELRRKIR